MMSMESMTLPSSDLDIFGRKGYLSTQFEGEHDHTADPEWYNIPASFQSRCRKVLFEVFCFIWPSQGTERPNSVNNGQMWTRGYVNNECHNSSR